MAAQELRFAPPAPSEDQGGWWGADSVSCLYQQCAECELVLSAYAEARLQDQGLLALAAACAGGEGIDAASLGAELAVRGEMTFTVPVRGGAVTLAVALPRAYPELPLQCSICDVGSLPLPLPSSSSASPSIRRRLEKARRPPETMSATTARAVARDGHAPAT